MYYEWGLLIQIQPTYTVIETTKSVMGNCLTALQKLVEPKRFFAPNLSPTPTIMARKHSLGLNMSIPTHGDLLSDAYCHLLPQINDDQKQEESISTSPISPKSPFNHKSPIPVPHPMVPIRNTKYNGKSIIQFKKEWNKGKQIGWGGQGSVFMVTPKDNNRINNNYEFSPCSSPMLNASNSRTQSIEYCAKFIFFTNEDIYESVQDRIDAVHAICNEFNFVKNHQLLNYIDLYYDECNYYKAIIIMEKLGPSLQSKRDWNIHRNMNINNNIEDNECKSSEMWDIQKIAYDLAWNIKIIHDLDYAHFDIKKENILWNKTEQSWKIIDYGLARYIPPKDGHIKCTEYLGTKLWTAPEIDGAVNGNENGRIKECNLSQKCDIYSFGLVILNIAVGGNHYDGLCKERKSIFYGLNDHQNEMKLIKLLSTKEGNDELQNYLTKLENNGTIKTSLYQFLSKLLIFDATQRPNIDQILDMNYLRIL